MNLYNEKLKHLRDTVKSALDYSLSDNDDERQDNSRSVLSAMRYSLLGNGKRFRGILSLACCEIISGDYRKAIPAAVAVEMVHSYSLIHDDLPCMDDDDIRRGRPSCHIAYGISTALLAGDALLTLAFDELSKAENDLSIAKCVSILSRAAGYTGMIRGQELDLANEGRNDISFFELEEMHRLKTGRLIAAAAMMGGLLAGGNNDDLETIDNYANKLGIVFQIIDDILDISADKEKLGKPSGSDKKRDKRTYVTLYGIDRSREIAREKTEEAVEIICNKYAEKSLFLSEFAMDLLARRY